MSRLLFCLLLPILLAGCNATPKPTTTNEVSPNAAAANANAGGMLERQYAFAERLAERLNNKDSNGLWNRTAVLEYAQATTQQPIQPQGFSQLFEQRFNTLVSRASDWLVEAVRDDQILLSNYVRGLPGIVVFYFRDNPQAREPELLDWQMQDGFARGSTVFSAYMKHVSTLSDSGFVQLAMKIKNGQVVSMEQVVAVYHTFSDEARKDPIIMGDYLAMAWLLDLDLPKDILKQISTDTPELTLDNAQPWASVTAMAGELDKSLYAIELAKANYGETFGQQRLSNALVLASSGFIPAANKEFLEYWRARPEELQGPLLYFMVLVEMAAFEDAAIVKQALRLQFQIESDQEMLPHSDSEKLREFIASPANRALN